MVKKHKRELEKWLTDYEHLALAEDPDLVTRTQIGWLELSDIPVPRDLMPSSGLCRHLHVQGAQTYTQGTHIR